MLRTEEFFLRPFFRAAREDALVLLTRRGIITDGIRMMKINSEVNMRKFWLFFCCIFLFCQIPYCGAGEQVTKVNAASWNAAFLRYSISSSAISSCWIRS